MGPVGGSGLGEVGTTRLLKEALEEISWLELYLQTTKSAETVY